MKLRFFFPEHISEFAYAVLYQNRTVFRNPLFHLCFAEPTQSHLHMPSKTVCELALPMPHYALCNRFWLEEKEFSLLTCLPKDAELLQTAEPEGLMQTVADLFRAVLAFTDEKNTLRTTMRVETLFQDTCKIIKEEISSSLIMDTDLSGTDGVTTSLDRDSFMLVIGLLVPPLAGAGHLHASLERSAGGATITLLSDGAIHNPFHRSLARAIGAACGFTLTFTDNGVRLLLPAAAPTDSLVLAADLACDTITVQIGMLLSDGAGQATECP
jgi:hypothetical protein